MTFQLKSKKYAIHKLFVILSLFYCTAIYADDGLNSLPERQWLIKKYFPNLSGRILFVGVGSYTSEYYKYVSTPEQFETIELLAEKAKYGSPFGHHIGDFINFDPGYKYDHICLFGVMGVIEDDRSKGSIYTIVNEDAIAQALEHANYLLKIGGTLQIGPDCVTIPLYNFEYWKDRFRKFSSNKYKILENKEGPFNLIWWGEKIR